VTFENVSDNPSTAARTVAVVVNDGEDDSNTVNKTVNVVVVNDAPIIAVNAPLGVAPGGTSTVSNTILQLTDPDNTPAQITMTVTGLPNNGVLKRSGSTLTLGGTFTQADVDNGLVTYEHDGGASASDTIDFTASDGAGGTIGTTTLNVTVNSFLNFNNFSIDPFSGHGQDKTGPVTIEDNGATLHMVGNRWKKIDLSYNVTPNTVIEFDFASGAEGEVHAIGFDNDNSISANRMFKVHGNQNWGINNFDNYDSSPNYKHYTIPIGQFYTGNFPYLVFANDHDVSNPTGESFFKNILIYESS